MDRNNGNETLGTSGVESTWTDTEPRTRSSRIRRRLGPDRQEQLEDQVLLAIASLTPRDLYDALVTVPRCDPDAYIYAAESGRRVSIATLYSVCEHLREDGRIVTYGGRWYTVMSGGR